MPRRRRLQVTGLPVHIIQRGNNRQACFFAEADYPFFLHHLGELAKRFQCELHAYVLMTNHLHLLLTPYFARGPSLLMKLLGQRYVQYVNRTYRRSGTLWEGRFRSSFIQDERYVLACYRYIEMNPVRASMVKHPLEYPWSSHAANTGERAMAWLKPRSEYLALGLDDESRRAAYRDLFGTDLDRDILRGMRISVHSGYAIGGNRFREQIESALRLRATPRGLERRPTAGNRL